MTILFFARRFYPLIGGVEKHVFELSKRLLAKGHRIIVITEQASADLKSIEIVRAGKGKLEIVRIDGGKQDRLKKIRLWNALWRLRKVIKSADIIHCHDVFFWYLPFRFLYPLKPVFTTFHGYESYPIAKKAILIRKLTEVLSNGNICIGDFIRKWYKTNPNYVSYGAVDIPKNQTTQARNKQSAVFFGRLDVQTGIQTYVQVFKELKKHFPKFIFLVVGEGEYKKMLNKEIKTIGFQQNPEKHFKTHNFAFVSRYLSMLEAFAAKRVVIAVYDNPVKEDYLRMAPFSEWIIIETDPHAAAQKIIALLANPKKEKIMIENAYNWVQKQTWEEMANLYLKLWHR